MSTLSHAEKQALYQEAMSLLLRAETLLTGIGERCQAKIERLKASKFEELTPQEQKLLQAQLEFEGKPIC